MVVIRTLLDKKFSCNRVSELIGTGEPYTYVETYIYPLSLIHISVTSVIKKRYLPSHIILGEKFGLKKPSMVLLEQIRTVNREDLREYIGTVDDDKLFRQINATLSLIHI